jgi:glycogen synthase
VGGATRVATTLTAGACGCRLRILLVTPRYSPYVGGIETHTAEVAKRFANAGHDVTVLTTDLSGRLSRDERVDGVRVLRVKAWPARRDYYVAPGIYRAILRGHWDVVHCQGYHTFVAPLAMLGAVRAGLPYVVSFHSGGHSSDLRKALRPLQRALLRPLLARASRLIASTAFELELFQQHLKLPPGRFVIVSNGSGLPCPTAWPGACDETLIVSVGRLERYKGHHRVIAALPKLIHERPNVRLRIVGTGPYEPNLRRLASRLGVSDRVEIGEISAGDREGMANLLARATLVILLSDYESQGVAVLEALALGRPALVSDTSALSELARQGLARATPVQSTPDRVAAAVLDQLLDPLLPGDARLPSWDDCADALLGIYAAVVRSHAPACRYLPMVAFKGHSADVVG